MTKALTIVLIAIIALVIGWHLSYFLLGGAIAVTATIWSIIVVSVITFCLAILLAFILTGVGVLVLGILAFIWTVIAVVSFPIVFPILVPLLIILLFISYLRRREQRKQANLLRENEKI